MWHHGVCFQGWILLQSVEYRVHIQGNNEYSWISQIDTFKIIWDGVTWFLDTFGCWSFNDRWKLSLWQVNNQELDATRGFTWPAMLGCFYILWREMREGLLIHTHPTRLSYTDSTTVEKVNVHPKAIVDMSWPTRGPKDAIPRCNRNKSPWDGSVPCPAGWLPQENTATSIFLRSSRFTCSEGAYFAQIFNYWILLNIDILQVIWLFLYVPPWLLTYPWYPWRFCAKYGYLWIFW